MNSACDTTRKDPSSKLSDGYGRGPWYVGYLRNSVTGEERTRVHTYCYKMAAVMNVLQPEANWQMIWLVGPYDSLTDALQQRIPADYSLYRWKGNNEPLTDREQPVVERRRRTMRELKLL